MRINQFVAAATGLSRRAVDKAIVDNRVKLNGSIAKVGQQVSVGDQIYLDSKLVSLPEKSTILLVNKPIGYVCSRDGQGSQTIYDLLPDKYKQLKLVGRLDKDSSGLLIMTDDGNLSFSLTHPKFSKLKTYLVQLDKPLGLDHLLEINQGRVMLDDKPSLMSVESKNSHINYEVSLSEGRNRQIRRTFEKLGYQVTKLERLSIGEYQLSDLDGQPWKEL